MTKLYNIKSQKNIRKALRSQQVGYEILLWKKLKSKQTGYKFRRQFGIGKYVVDFYCPKLKFAIEIDGSTHCTKEELENDNIRQNFLENLGIEVKRYLNGDVYSNTELILMDIINTCKKLAKTPPNLSTPC